MGKKLLASFGRMRNNYITAARRFIPPHKKKRQITCEYASVSIKYATAIVHLMCIQERSAATNLITKSHVNTLQ